MIVPMKKAVIITLEKDRERALKDLRAAGVLHLERSGGEVSSKDFTSLQNKWNRLEKVLTHLPKEETNELADPQWDKAQDLVEQIVAWEKEYKEVQDQLNQIHLDLEVLDFWDNIDPADLQWLSDKGCITKLYQMPEKDFDVDGWQDNLYWHRKHKGLAQCLFVFQEGQEMPDWEEPELPEQSNTALEALRDDLEKEQEELDKQLIDFAKDKELLLWYQDELQSRLEWEEAKLRFEEEESIIHLSGYIPLPEKERVSQLAKEKQWGLLLTDPSEEDVVPTKLKNGKVGSLLTPVLDLLGITPGYKEFDISFFFLSFFTVFAAMLIGDAGYGSIFLAAVLFFIVKTLFAGKIPGKGLALLTLLSLTTVIWGAINGNWFGSSLGTDIPFLSQFRLEVFTGSESHVNDKIMRISFFLGVVQLGLACIQRFIRELPDLKSFAQLGWFGVIVGMYYLVLNQVLGDTSMAFSVVFKIMGAGLALILIFGNQKKGQNFFIGVLKALPNLFNLFLDVVGSFANIMSYIRLFAVGLASLKIAQTFNTMAAPLLEGGLSTIGAVGILLAGHSLNIVLALLAVFVHAIRLNVLEYSGQLGMEWSGFKYEPFRVSNGN